MDYTKASAGITNISSLEEIENGLEQVLRWPVSVHNAASMERWRDAVDMLEKANDSEGYIQAGKKFLGRCLKGGEEFAAKYPITRGLK